MKSPEPPKAIAPYAKLPRLLRSSSQVPQLAEAVQEFLWFDEFMLRHWVLLRVQTRHNIIKLARQ